MYQYAMYQGFDESHARDFVFTTLIAANIFLTLANRSFYYSVITTLQYTNNLVPVIISIIISITAPLLFVKPFSKFFLFEPLNISELGISINIGFISVTWYETVK